MDDNGFGRALGGPVAGPSSRGPAPRRGHDRAFDIYFDEYMGDEVPEGDIGEMRTAAWATWRTEAPIAAPPRPRVDDEEDELERVLAMSREEFSRPASAQGDDLERALALSREDHSRPASAGPVLEDDDEDLRRAIAMSEEEARAPKRRRRDETPEEERRMLEEALAASLAAEEAEKPKTTPLIRGESDELIRAANDEFQAQRAADRAAQAEARLAKQKAAAEASAPAPASSVPTIVPRPEAPPAAHQPGMPNPMLLDRAAMEAERLARQKAKGSGGGPARTQSASSSGGPVRTQSAASAGPSNQTSASSSSIHNQPRTIFSTPAGPSASSNGISTQARPSVQHLYQSTHPFPSDAAGEYYLDGELRHTELQIGTHNSDPTFSATNIIGEKSQISLLILNSFVIEDEWLQSILPDPAAVPQVIIRPHPTSQPDWEGKVQAQVNEQVFCYPKMHAAYGSAHMKYIWIWYKTGRLRVIISTANFVPYDWEWIENTIFVQDFLLLPSPQPLRPNHKSHDFPLQFAHLFKHVKVHKALDFLVNNHLKGARIPIAADASFGDMAKYDWSRVTVRLVLSIPGMYEGWENMERFGMCRIGQVAKEEGWKAGRGEKAVVEYQGSSLGTYGLDWFTHFHQLCSGKSARELANQPKAKSWAPIKIIYPSLATVDDSEAGRGGGGTMFVGKSWNSVMKPHFHDSNSKCGGVLLHAKLLVTTFEPQEQSLGFAPVPSSANGKRKAEEMEDDSETAGGWMYVGSHNFSSSAWGTVNLKKSPPTLNIKNYELGIMFPLRGANKMADRIVPYKRPVRQYGADDVPWDQGLHMPKDGAAGH